jgi:hypothetical protein
MEASALSVMESSGRAAAVSYVIAFCRIFVGKSDVFVYDGKCMDKFLIGQEDEEKIYIFFGGRNLPVENQNE